MSGLCGWLAPHGQPGEGGGAASAALLAAMAAPLARFDASAVSSELGGASAAAVAAGVNLRKVDADHVGVSLDETITRADLAVLWDIFANGVTPAPDFDAVEAGVQNAFPAALGRSSAYLSHPVFNRYHSEHEMLRYLRSLADKDLALTAP